MIQPSLDDVDDLYRTLLTRSRLLGARQGLRAKKALLAHALDGQTHAVIPYRDDPLAVEPESLLPWGPPPDGGGHRSKLAPGLHQHSFDGTTRPFPLQSNESILGLRVWVYLDPDHPLPPDGADAGGRLRARRQ